MEREREFNDKVRTYQEILVQEYDKHVFEYVIKSMQVLLINHEVEKMLELGKWAKAYLNQVCKKEYNGDLWELEAYTFEKNFKHELIEYFYEICLIESFDHFESFVFYLERNRPQEKRFYLPRRCTLKYVAVDLERLEKGDLIFYGLSMPSRTGKSTLCILFLLWVMLRRPDSHNAMGGHSGILAKGFYKELLNFMTSAEYTFAEIYEYHHPGWEMLESNSAEEYTINLHTPDRFSTITCRGIEGTWTGAIDVSSDGYLYVDDLIKDRKHSLNPNRMEQTFQDYQNHMLDRLNDGSKQLMVGTLWNVMDPLERIREKHEGEPGYLFRKIPALNSKDESNFQYSMGKGFGTQYYRNMRDALDDADWCAKFQQKPYRREGLMFPTDELNYYNGILPEGDHRIVAVCDVAFGGGDNLSMPIGAEYEDGDVYIFGWIYDKSPKEITIPRVVGRIMAYDIGSIQFEANNGGDLYAEKVDAMLQEYGFACNCTSKKAPNTMDKRSKIEQYSGDIKRKFYFISKHRLTPEERELDRQNGVIRYERDQDYTRAMDDLCDYVTIGENEHDDSPDSLTQLAMKLAGTKMNSATAAFNPFRG